MRKLNTTETIRALRDCAQSKRGMNVDICRKCPVWEGQQPHDCYDMLRHAANLLEDNDERIAIMAEGGAVKVQELEHQLLLLSACAGHLNGEQMLEAVEKALKAMPRI